MNMIESSLEMKLNTLLLAKQNLIFKKSLNKNSIPIDKCLLNVYEIPVRNSNIEIEILVFC